MGFSFSDQFAGIVRRARNPAQAYICEGDPTSAVVWDIDNEITIRLSLKDDEVWLIAGSGTMVRFVADSNGDFDHDGIDFVISSILLSEVVEHFGAAGKLEYDFVVTGNQIGPMNEYGGGLTAEESKFQARIAGPIAAAQVVTE